MELLNNYKSNLHKQQIFPAFLTKHLQNKIIFDTTVQQSYNGIESRFAKRNIPLKEYCINNYQIKREDLKELDCFFNDKLGKLYSFLLWDLNNHYVEDAYLTKAPPGLFTFLDAEENAYWLSKKYNDSNQEGSYKIIKTPIKKTINIFPKEGESNFRYEEEHGVFVSKVDSLPDDLKIHCHFFTPVRFDNDILEYQESFDCIILHNLKLKEVLL